MLVEATASFQVTLNTTTEQFARLRELQVVFAAVCNAISPIASGQRCWNRVALHHLTYKDMRARFPELGSQMVCNAIYAVSKTSRLIYQHPDSPFHVKKLGAQKLPTLKFSDICPVYFDSHTLTLNGEKLSMFTMDGRIKFLLTLSQVQQTALKTHRLGEISLSQNPHGQYMLTFAFNTDVSVDADPTMGTPTTERSQRTLPPAPTMNLPDYLGLESTP
jgi:hypothetical protein